MIGNPLKVVALRRFAASTDATKLFNGNCTVDVKSNVRMVKMITFLKGTLVTFRF